MIQKEYMFLLVAIIIAILLFVIYKYRNNMKKSLGSKVDEWVKSQRKGAFF